jgi:hypothetical protein
MLPIIAEYDCGVTPLVSFLSETFEYPHGRTSLILRQPTLFFQNFFQRIYIRPEYRMFHLPFDIFVFGGAAPGYIPDCNGISSLMSKSRRAGKKLPELLKKFQEDWREGMPFR